MHLFLTGVAGFSGCHLARHMLQEGHTITAISRRSPEALPTDVSDHRRFSLIQRDLTALEELPRGTETVIHVAATSPTADTRIGDFILDNVVATERLVCLARKGGVKKFVFFSSLSVYGTITKQVVDESTPIVDPNAYGASKLLGELCLQEMASEIPSIAFRLPAIIGRGAARHWLANVLTCARAGRDIRIFNPQAAFNNAVHIRDLCVFIETLLSRSWNGFEAVTLGAEGQMSISDIVSHIVRAAKSSSQIVIDPNSRPFFLVSSKYATEFYGYLPMNIEAMLDLYLAESLT